jgi:hypothetical protein
MDGLDVTKTISKNMLESMGYLVHQPPWNNGEWMQHHHWRAPKLLDRLKCKFEVKIMEK